MVCTQGTEKGKIRPENFAQLAKNIYDISAIEYVNQFYVQQGNNQKFWSQMKNRADDVGVKSLLIMVDNEGNWGIRMVRSEKLL